MNFVFDTIIYIFLNTPVFDHPSKRGEFPHIVLQHALCNIHSPPLEGCLKGGVVILSNLNPQPSNPLPYILSNIKTQSLPSFGSAGGLKLCTPIFSISPITVDLPVLGSYHDALTLAPSILPILTLKSLPV